MSPTITRQADGSPWLPFKTGAPRVTRADWFAYREAAERHRTEYPQYDTGWRRPSMETARRAWELIGPHIGSDIDDLLPVHKWLTVNDRLELAAQALQALVVIVDAIGSSQTVNTNKAFDAVALRWSDHYRRTRETTAARVSWEMHPETLRRCWDDFGLIGLPFAALLRAAKGPQVDREATGIDGLYALTRQRHVVWKGDAARVERRGYKVTRGDHWDAFADILNSDTGYERARTYPRLLAAEQETGSQQPEWELDYELDEDLAERIGDYKSRVAAEWEYNVARNGLRGAETIRRLEDSRLHFNVLGFANDYAQLRIEHLRAPDGPEKDALTGQLVALEGVNDDLMRLFHRVGSVEDVVREQDGNDDNKLPAWARPVSEKDWPRFANAQKPYVLIRSRFFRTMNRRYQPEHFWPTEVTGKDEQIDALDDLNLNLKTSRRGRWFWAGTSNPIASEKNPEYLVGLDVSASQIQILAAFCGLDELEVEVTRRPFKNLVAQRAWERHRVPGDPFKLPSSEGMADYSKNDPRLESAVKQAVMTTLYGSELSEVAHNLGHRSEKALANKWVRDDPHLREIRSQFGPGLGDGENIARLLRDKDLNLSGIFDGFLPACRAIAKSAHKRDPHAGVTFTDPLDEVRVRWNPVMLARPPRRVAGGRGAKIFAKPPAGAMVSDGHAASCGVCQVGDYKVDPQKLARVVAPCLTHMLDALYAGIVVENLDARGVRNVVSIHDCWMVPQSQTPVLIDAVKASGEPWLRALGPVYDELAAYLADDPVHGQWASDIRARWRRRVAAGDRWPQFMTSPTFLVEPAGQIR